MTRSQRLLNIIEDNSVYVLKGATIGEVPRSEDDKENDWETSSDSFPRSVKMSGVTLTSTDVTEKKKKRNKYYKLPFFWGWNNYLGNNDDNDFSDGGDFGGDGGE